MTRNQPKHRGRPKGWDAVAQWYDGWMGKGGSIHHKKIAIPAVLELLNPQSSEKILDVGAGQGVLAPYITKVGADYIGIDVSHKLLNYAREYHSGTGARFLHADAAKLHNEPSMQAELYDAVVFLLSIQDMTPLDGVLRETAWVMKQGGRLVILMTHPAFRVPRQSGWGYDENRKLQYRRIDRYLTPLPVPMKQHPGRESGVTISFHRPISEYVNTLADCDLLIERLDEIPVGEGGVKQKHSKAEKMANDEIPLFLALRARKISN